MSSLQGHFLVASPHLPDENFYRSVVLIVQHDSEGAFGVVLNRPTENCVADRRNTDSDEVIEGDPIRGQVYLGGPVNGPLLGLHDVPSLAEAEVIPGVYLTRDEELLIEVMRSNSDLRLFSGYSGWSAGQLEGELDQGGWLICPAEAELVFYDAELLWKHVSKQIGLEILAPTIRRVPVPDDPSVN